MRKIALIGGPGTDRVSPGQVLARELGLEFISAGNLFRHHVQRSTPAGQQIVQYMRAGELVPHELTVSAIAEVLATAHLGWVLSGYPSHVEQAELLAQRGHEPEAVIELLLTEDEYRLVLRRHIELDPRQGERLDELMRMPSRHEQQIAPLRAYYEARGVLRTASGYGEFEQVAAGLVRLVSDR